MSSYVRSHAERGMIETFAVTGVPDKAAPFFKMALGSEEASIPVLISLARAYADDVRFDDAKLIIEQILARDSSQATCESLVALARRPGVDVALSPPCH